MNLDELQRLAEEASPMPWDTSPSDVPYAARKALQDALMRDDTAKKLIAVARAAQAALPVMVRDMRYLTGEEEALRTALEELK